MTKDFSPFKRQKNSGGLLQSLIVVMALMAIVFFGASHFLNSNGGLSSKFPGASTQSSPTNGQKIWLKNQASVRFEWSGYVSEDTFLEVSRDRDFQDLVLEEAAPKFPFLTDKLPGDGDYFYRIVQKSATQEQVQLPPIRFTLVTQSPPQLIYPFTPMSIPETKELRFYWQAKHGVTHYRFQIAFDGQFENLFSDLLLEETQTIPQKIPTGHFFWRVRGEDDATDATHWSEVRVLRAEGNSDSKAHRKPVEPPAQVVAVATPTAPPAPTLPPPAQQPPPSPPVPPPVAAKNRNTAPSKVLPIPKMAKASQRLTLRFREKSNLRSPASLQNALLNPPTLSWNKSKGASFYEVQISKKATFTPVEWTKTTSSPKIKWDAARPGKYFWRVQALDQSGAKSAFSSLNTLDLTLPAPKIKKSFSHSVNVKSEAQLAESSPMPVSWMEVPAASGYRVVVSDSKKFDSSLLDLKVERNLASIDLKENGEYYVKVAVLGPTGEIASEFSDMAALKYEKKYEKPVQVAKASLPAPKLKLPPNGVSIVSLNDSQDPISFKWENTDADAYQLEIAADEGFEQIVFSTVTRENQTVVTKPIPKGRLYWHLRAQKGPVKSDWSPTFSFEFAK